MESNKKEVLEALRYAKKRSMDCGGHYTVQDPEVAHALCVEIPYAIEEAIEGIMAQPAPKEVKEGPSVEDIMEVFDEFLPGLGRSEENELRTRLSALFTQTQVEPVAWIRYRDEAEPVVYSHGEKKRLLELRRFEEKDFAPLYAKPIEAEIPQREARGIGAESGVPVSGHSPSSTLVEQSEDAALPDGRWIPVSELPALVDRDGVQESERVLLRVSDAPRHMQVFITEYRIYPDGSRHWVNTAGYTPTHWMPLPIPPTI